MVIKKESCSRKTRGEGGGDGGRMWGREMGL